MLNQPISNLFKIDGYGFCDFILVLRLVMFERQTVELAEEIPIEEFKKLTGRSYIMLTTEAGSLYY